MDKRVDKGEDFRKSGMTLITEMIVSVICGKQRSQGCKEGEIFDNQEEWADGFCGK